MLGGKLNRRYLTRFAWFRYAAVLAFTLAASPLAADPLSDSRKGGAEGVALTVPLKQQLETAELVARVEITAVQRLIDHALSEPGMTAVTGYVYSGVTQRVWKGASVAHIAFRVHLADCVEKLTRGRQYLIFARTNARGYLELLSCEAAIANPETGNLLAELEQYYQG
ncbi:hypothetical protein [Microbulbifer sp. ARAS458-1]|uniref:hypothetical protein n=1 Tax=Microbulbifer sp. ARAS458-1 TaxID=3140242 RepID=UPI003877BDDC